jgi:hypothetical protein
MSIDLDPTAFDSENLSGLDLPGLAGAAVVGDASVVGIGCAAAIGGGCAAAMGGGCAATVVDGGGAVCAPSSRANSSSILAASAGLRRTTVGGDGSTGGGGCCDGGAATGATAGTAAVGATDLEAPFGQDAGEGGHADASDSNEVERLLAIEQQGQVHLRVEPKISGRRHPSFYWLLLFLASLALRLMARRRADPGLPIGLRGSAEIRSVGSAPETP